MQQNITRMSPRGLGDDESRTRNASRARKRQVRREHRGDRRKVNSYLRCSVGDYSDWL